MVNIPSVPEIITVNSEELQTQIRELLPSQNGFGSELQASNVITPIIDLTATAEGSRLPTYLQTALSFGSQTAFEVSNTSTTIANSPGFYRITAVSTQKSDAGNIYSNQIELTDGSSTKIVWKAVCIAASAEYSQVINVDVTVWLAAGESVAIVTGDAKGFMAGSVRQVANSQGALVQPVGYPL